MIALWTSSRTGRQTEKLMQQEEESGGGTKRRKRFIYLISIRLASEIEILSSVLVAEFNRRHDITRWFLLLLLMMSVPISFCLFTFSPWTFFLSFLTLRIFFLLFLCVCICVGGGGGDNGGDDDDEEQTIISCSSLPFFTLIFTDFCFKFTNVYICIINTQKLYIFFIFPYICWYIFSFFFLRNFFFFFAAVVVVGFIVDNDYYLPFIIRLVSLKLLRSLYCLICRHIGNIFFSWWIIWIIFSAYAPIWFNKCESAITETIKNKQFCD